MAASVDMFGPGGEGLGGLFVGNQMAQQQALNEAQVQQAQASAAHANALAAGTDLSNQYEQAIMGDKIQAYKEDVLQKRQAAQADKFNRQGEAFGKMSVALQNLPAAARPAALVQMAQQAGVDENNPMFKTLSQVNPEELPATMQKFSQGFYEQSDAARAEKQKRDAILAQKREEIEARNQQIQDQIQGRRDIADQASADRRFIAGLVASSRDKATAARGAGKSGGGLDKMTIDQRISYYENKAAMEGGLSDDEQAALERMKNFALSKQTVGKTGTTEDIMGLPSPAERTAQAARGGSSPTTAARPAAPKVGTESKGYRFKGGDPSKRENWEKM